MVAKGIVPKSHANPIQGVGDIFCLLVTQQVPAGYKAIQEFKEYSGVLQASVVQEGCQRFPLYLLQLFVKCIDAHHPLHRNQVIKDQLQANMCKKERFYRAIAKDRQQDQFQFVALGFEKIRRVKKVVDLDMSFPAF